MNVFDLRSQRWHEQEAGVTFGNEVQNQSKLAHQSSIALSLCMNASQNPYYDDWC